MSEQQYVGNVKSAVVDRNQLLSILKENKARHDALLEAAVSGYWLAVKERVEQKRTEFKEYDNNLNSYFYKLTDILLDKIEKKEKVDDCGHINVPKPNFNYMIDLRYPESHTAEYNRAIRSVELNVYDKIELSESEFNQYVMNDWSWKNSFILSNSLYVLSGAASVTGFYGNSIRSSGCLIL